MRRRAHEPAVAVTRALATLASLFVACDGTDRPEDVADHFVEAYFVTADQDEALKFATGRARRVLEHELDLVRDVRSEGYGAAEAHPPTYVTRGAVRREGSDRVTVRYRVEIATGDPGIEKSVDVHVERTRGGWKVSTFRLHEPPR